MSQGYTYNSLFQSLCNSLAIVSSVTPPFTSSATLDPNWAIELPFILGNAEQRVYRDLDLMAMRVTDVSGSMVSQQRTFTLPTTQGTYITVEYVSVFTPAGAQSSNGSRNPLIPVSRAVVDGDWPAGTAIAPGILGVPREFAMISNTQMILGPSPDQNYNVEVTGTQRPAPLSSGNQTTWIATWLPDVFFAACMSNAAMYMRDFGDPQVGQAWEMKYQQYLKTADNEEARKFFRSQGWTAQAPRQVTTPPRQ